MCCQDDNLRIQVHKKNSSYDDLSFLIGMSQNNNDRNLWNNKLSIEKFMVN